MSRSPRPVSGPLVVDGRYSLVRKLGSGTMGTVYLAHDDRLRRRVALKILHTEQLLAGATSMQEEFRAVASLRHPRLAQAYDFGYTEGGLPYYTREYVPGDPIAAGPPKTETPAELLLPFLHLLEALEYVHSQGILHLDIHAGNVIVSDAPDRGTVLIDFGFRSAGGLRSTRDAEWHSLPPEMLEREKPTRRTDIFLVGRLLEYRLTGQISGRPRLPREIPGWGARATLELERIVHKALQPEPGRRFSSAQEFHDALSRIAGASPLGAPRVASHVALRGRDTELGLLDETLRSTAAGSARVLWLSGRKGLGKTRLLREARVRAQLRGLKTVDVRFLAASDREPALARALQGAGNRAQSSWARLLDPRSGGSPGERARRAADAFFAAGIGPLVILADDVDLADRDSRELLDALVSECLRRRNETGCGMALFLASEQPPRSLLPGAGSCPAVALKPLGAADGAALLGELLEPLVPPEELVRRALHDSEGVPAALARMASALLREWRERGVIPETALLPVAGSDPAVPGSLSGGERDWSPLDAGERAVVEALASLGRAATRRELSILLDRPPATIATIVRRLTKAEAIASRGRGPSRTYLLDPDLARAAAGRISGADRRRVHERMARLLQRTIGGARGAARAHALENLARHLLACGKREEARTAAGRAVAALREKGLFARAVGLLEDLAEGESDPRPRLEALERLASVLEEIGDHERAARLLESVFAAGVPTPDRDAVVRVKRRLGICYHRTGRAEDAVTAFRELGELADPERHLEDLVFVDSELAELAIFRGEFEQAETACRRGLERLKAWSGGEDFRGRMEVTLRATLGHIHMRRLELDEACAELRDALRLSRRRGTPSERAAILHNLGAAQNQLSDFAAARKSFREAGRVFRRLGATRDVVKVSTNLALIEAKLGDRSLARLELERASDLLRRSPEKRLEFFLAYSRGVVALAFGDVDDAVTALEASTAGAEKLGDRPLHAFGLAYLAEANAFMGRYSAALEILDRASAISREGPAALGRVILSRKYLVHALLGDSLGAAEACRDLEASPRTAIAFMECWNDLFIGLGRVLEGDDPSAGVEAAIRFFEEIGFAQGVRLGRLVLLASALRSGNVAGLRNGLRLLGSAPETPHLFLQVAEPLAIARVRLDLGERGEAEKWLDIASSAAVGKPFLELDLHLELLRARLAARDGSVREARLHLHRSAHSRELLLRLVPDSIASSFFDQDRFSVLGELEERLRRSPDGRTTPARDAGTPRIGTRRQGQLHRHGAMVGRAPAMAALFATLERIRYQELPVLIGGETGTGKELVARAVHEASARRSKALSIVHCACLPNELFESELFGHVAGAFTGAETDQEGLLEAASGGTLLLDEIGDLALESQAKLLRFLESGSVRRLGSTETRVVDVRILATTSVRLDEAVESRRFRADLYYRLRAIELVVPPLRDRREDIALLARHFLERHAARLDCEVPELLPDGVTYLERREWPGNVRELELFLLRVLVQSAGAGRLGEGELSALRGHEPARPSSDLLARSLRERRQELERDYLSRLFVELGGDMGRMMKQLDVRSTKLYDWMRDLGLDIRELRRRLRG